MQYIKLLIGVEQNLLVNYGKVKYRFDIRFNDYSDYWYFNIYINSTNQLLLSGIKIKLDYDLFEGLGLNLGKLYLVDTIDDGTDFDIKRDFGNKLKLLRDYNA